VAVTLLVAATVGLDGKPVRRPTAFDIDAGAIDNTDETRTTFDWILD
jgi:hypothetical protein